MGHAGAAAAAVRYLKALPGGGMADGAPRPRPELRCVAEGERAPAVQGRAGRAAAEADTGSGTAIHAGTAVHADTAIHPDATVVPGVEQSEFRRVLGNFATGVTVVTAPAVPGEPGPAGFACQSFSSLSLDPPLVVFMVGRTSASWPRIALAGVFCVNVLSREQAELCRAFARSGGDKFAGVAYDTAPVSGAPRLTGALAWVDCAIQAVHTGGDHLIVVGKVNALGTAPGAEEQAPMLFHKGRFL